MRTTAVSGGATALNRFDQPQRLLTPIQGSDGGVAGAPPLPGRPGRKGW